MTYESTLQTQIEPFLALASDAISAKINCSILELEKDSQDDASSEVNEITSLQDWKNSMIKNTPNERHIIYISSIKGIKQHDSFNNTIVECLLRLIKAHPKADCGTVGLPVNFLLCWKSDHNYGWGTVRIFDYIDAGGKKKYNVCYSNTLQGMLAKEYEEKTKYLANTFQIALTSAMNVAVEDVVVICLKLKLTSLAGLFYEFSSETSGNFNTDQVETELSVRRFCHNVNLHNLLPKSRLARRTRLDIEHREIPLVSERLRDTARTGTVTVTEPTVASSVTMADSVHTTNPDGDEEDEAVAKETEQGDSVDGLDGMQFKPGHEDNMFGSGEDNQIAADAVAAGVAAEEKDRVRCSDAAEVARGEAEAEKREQVLVDSNNEAGNIRTAGGFGTDGGGIDNDGCTADQGGTGDQHTFDIETSANATNAETGEHNNAGGGDVTGAYAAPEVTTPGIAGVVAVERSRDTDTSGTESNANSEEFGCDFAATSATGEANVDESNVSESTVLTEATIKANVEVARATIVAYENEDDEKSTEKTNRVEAVESVHKESLAAEEEQLEAVATADKERLAEEKKTEAVETANNEILAEETQLEAGAKATAEKDSLAEERHIADDEEKYVDYSEDDYSEKFPVVFDYESVDYSVVFDCDDTNSEKEPVAKESEQGDSEDVPYGKAANDNEAATMKNQAEVDEASTENLTKLPVAKESKLGDSVDVPDGRAAAIRQMIKEKTKAAEKQASATMFNDLTQDMTEKWIRKGHYRDTYKSCGLFFYPILRYTVFDGYWKKGKIETMYQNIITQDLELPVYPGHKSLLGTFTSGATRPLWDDLIKPYTNDTAGIQDKLHFWLFYIIASQLLWDKFINYHKEIKSSIHTLFDPATIKINADTNDYKVVIIGGLKNYKEWIMYGIPRVDKITCDLKKIIEAAGGEDISSLTVVSESFGILDIGGCDRDELAKLDEIDGYDQLIHRVLQDNYNDGRGSKFNVGLTDAIFPFVVRATVKMIDLAIERINDKNEINADIFPRLTNDVLCLLNGLAFHHCCILKKTFPDGFVTCKNFNGILTPALFFIHESGGIYNNKVCKKMSKFYLSPYNDESKKNARTTLKIRKRERTEEEDSAELQARNKNNKGEESQMV